MRRLQVVQDQGGLDFWGGALRAYHLVSGLGFRGLGLISLGLRVKGLGLTRAAGLGFRA